MAEQVGTRLLPTAAVSPTQNAPCERAGGAWKFHAKRLIDQFSVKWSHPSDKLWLCAMMNWATNSSVENTGYNPSEWVLGRSVRLRYQMLSKASQLASHQRHTQTTSGVNDVLSCSLLRRGRS